MTVREIANLANVSPTTVSIVLNNKSGVGEETRKKVLKIAEEGGYRLKQREQPKEARKSIRFIRYREDGMLTERNGDFIARVMDGIELEAREKGFELKITNVTTSSIKDIISFINEEMSDCGIIFLGTEFMPESADILKLFKMPVVVIDNEMKYTEIDSVDMCNRDIIYTAIKHLYDLGHRKIGHIKSAKRTSNLKERSIQYKMVMEEFGLELNPEFTYSAQPELEMAYETIKKELGLRKCELPTAFFADNDVLAIAAMKALKETGVKIPDDISVIGIDDLAISSACEPALTTMKVHKMTMGRVAVRRLIELLDNWDAGANKIYVGSVLVVRDSTCVCGR